MFIHGEQSDECPTWRERLLTSVEYSQIVSIYAGITGRTAVSVLAQYVATLARGGVMPQILRSDCGGETPMAADFHYTMRQRLQHNQEDELTFSMCFRFGTSKQNSRIETWWYQNSAGGMLRWREHFLWLDKEAHYVRDKLSDRIAFLYIYIPIIREEIAAFVALWNDHTIRKQPERPYTVHGIPSKLYNYPEDAEDGQEPGVQCGVPVNLEDIQDTIRELEGFSKHCTLTVIVVRLTSTADLDEFLPAETLAFCDSFLQSCDFVLPITGQQFEATDGRKVHLDAYLSLRDCLRAHILSGVEPILGESPKPYAGPHGWQASDGLRRAFAEAGEQLPFTDELGAPVNELDAFYNDGGVGAVA